jgi:hypothetical protein
MPNILSKKELRLLLKVPTSVRQAKQIIKRNTLALKALRANEMKEFHVGCPHCKCKCSTCAYPTYKGCFGDQCLHYMFGGVNYYNINGFIRLAPSSIRVEGISQDIEFAERWLLGHIEWAEAVIKDKGTPKRARKKNP